MRRPCVVTAAVVATLAFPASAPAAPKPPLGLTDCAPTQGVYACSGLVKTRDGVPLDATVVLPSKNARDLPLVDEIHGFGNSKYEYLDPASTAYTDNAFAWARDGYAVLDYTARGLWGSCGTPDSRAANPTACAAGYIHLADVRYEVRDSQYLIGRLVDSGFAAAGRIGVTGDSYGGGQSLMLAALRDRTMRPSGELVPWRTPAGKRLSIAAAAPVIPWSDLVSAAAPNGRVSATGVTGRRRATHPVGVEKATFVNAIFAAAQFATGPGQPIGEPFVPGRPMGFLAPTGTDPDADVAAWVSRTDQGEPYDDASARAIVAKLANYHSAYYIDPSHPPPPLFMSSGFTDDLFPVDETLRYANRTRRLHPHVPISLLYGDLGHQRAANKPAERRRLIVAIHRWFDYYLRRKGPAPRAGVTAYVETCPRSRPSLGPFHSRTFAGLSRRTLRFHSKPAQTVTSDGGDPAVGAAIDPVGGGGDSCKTTSAAKAPGTARYVLRKAKRRSFTLIGAPRLRARLKVQGAAPSSSQLDARLWDVAPGGTQVLVARGTYRPRNGANSWQLHPGAWRFRRGHSAVLELVGDDPPSARPSNDSFTIGVRNLRVSLPVR
jgi:X-Pro dipeptidyl-peptidase (S15 family)